MAFTDDETYDLSDVVQGLAAINTTLIRGFALVASAIYWGSSSADANVLSTAREEFTDFMLPK